ncbi:MAG: tRNA (adenosine(37)-N6)-threonylcarbamoyltransferase complex transferase subunit TsaD [Candidatus Omnitrophica bacterium]|nr:tRNA (adenosine(37)-N6)-threonylcarbamoyltransferase complex transferase subunit TsaD [Candidatus Omnitrophota bacterium]
MNVLGIETSCDETAAAVVKDGKSILSSVVSSSLKYHTKYGGVIPEIAFRMQLETITQVSDAALRNANLKLDKIGLVSVTSGPGLLGSLLVGISFAKALSLAKNIPLNSVNHLYGHIYASFLDKSPVALPFVSLVVSGGHTSLFYVKDFDKISLLGSTHDDACGEAFDKVAKILGLGYPGGPIIEKFARGGNPKKIRFKCSDTNNPLDFSFSGIKTAVLYYLQDELRKNKKAKKPSLNLMRDIAASFQEAAVKTLINKSLLACKLKGIRRLVVGGGVAANNRLRDQFYDLAKASRAQVYFPDKALCMDNAAMVAGLGYRLFKKGHISSLDLNVALA